jgi:VIT1/CCC1 family predicted Fe2+/Mn2+ transporter
MSHLVEAYIEKIKDLDRLRGYYGDKLSEETEEFYNDVLDSIWYRMSEKEIRLVEKKLSRARIFRKIFICFEGFMYIFGFLMFVALFSGVTQPKSGMSIIFYTTILVGFFLLMRGAVNYLHDVKKRWWGP